MQCMVNEWYVDPNHAVVEFILGYRFYRILPLTGVVVAMGCTHG